MLSAPADFSGLVCDAGSPQPAFDTKIRSEVRANTVTRVGILISIWSSSTRGDRDGATAVESQDISGHRTSSGRRSVPITSGRCMGEIYTILIACVHSRRTQRYLEDRTRPHATIGLMLWVGLRIRQLVTEMAALRADAAMQRRSIHGRSRAGAGALRLRAERKENSP